MAQKFGNSKIITNFAVLITYKAERKNRKQSKACSTTPIWASNCSSNSKRNANAHKHCDKPSLNKRRKSNTLTPC